MKRRALLLIPIVALATVSSAQIDPARVVAVVNGEEIKGAEYYRSMETIPNPARPNAAASMALPTGLLAIDQLIRERLIFQLAKQKNVSPTDVEVQAEYAAGLAANPKFLENYQSLGRTEAELRAQLRLEIAQYKLVTSGVTLTDQEIDTHYTTYKSTEFTVPRRFQSRVIIVADEAGKAAVDADLSAGKSFESVARTRSLDPTSQIGGILTPLDEPRLPADIQAAFKGVGTNQNTPWVKQSSNGATAWAKFHMDSVTAPRVLPLDADLKKQIRRKLSLDKGGVKFDLVRELLLFQSKSKIDVRIKEFAAQYKTLMDSLYLRQGITKP